MQRMDIIKIIPFISETQRMTKKVKNKKAKRVPRTSIKMCIHNLTNPFIVMHADSLQQFIQNDKRYVWKLLLLLSSLSHFDDFFVLKKYIYLNIAHLIVSLHIQQN